MKRKHSIFLLLICLNILLASSLVAQDTIPIKYSEGMSSYYGKFKQHDISENLKETYAQQFAKSKYDLTFYHKIYYQQPLLEEYIRSIFGKLLPEEDELAELEIFITKSTDFNAFTISDGSIFVNISALAQMSNEAELAFLLGHEYAHYLLKHGISSYQKKFNKNGKKKKIRLKDIQDLNEFSQKNEFASDSLALILGVEAGYDRRAMEILIQKLIFLQKKDVLRFNDNYDPRLVYPTSHPAGEERLLKIKSIAINKTGGELFLLEESRYNKVKEIAEYEFLKLLDEEFDLHQAMSFPLKQYLLTGKEVYLPTLVRAIRKIMVLAPAIEDKGFMVAHFKEYEERFGDKENILNNLHLEYPDSNEIVKIKAKSIINFERIPFYSYKEAFNYFSKKAIKAGYSEPHLDVVLYHGVKSSKGRGSLKRYLSNPNNLYYEYALLLKKKTLHEELEGRDKIILVGGLSKYEYRKKAFKVDHVKNYEERNQLLTSVRNKYLNDSLHYKIYNYSDYYRSSPLGPYLRTIERLVYSGRSEMLLSYDPRLYYAFKKANINSLEFMSLQHLKYKNQTWRTALRMLPPFTISTISGLITRHPDYSSNLNFMNYYGCYLYNEKMYGKAYSQVKAGKISDEKAANMLYKMQREQKTFTRTKRFLKIFKVDVKDRTEWRY